ncbi:MAG: protein kinase [Thermoanaerobaculales bacterium]
MQPGTRLGPYEVVAAIGAGGMGEVYRARDTRLGRDVAIKVLPAEFAADPDRLRRFEQEARAVAALSHPHILALFDVGTHEGSPYLVTELLEGESLLERLQAGPLNPRKATEVGAEIAQGLAAAHAKGIVHRDLKPGNVFITKDGVVKILDFGIAKLVAPGGPEELGRATTVVEATEAGTLLGTVGYMSPEQVRGQSVDHRTDIFSFGCVLYEMLSGRSPFRKDTAAETMTAILTKDPDPLSGTGREVSPVLQGILSRCLEKSPQDRFHSAHDLAFDLASLGRISDTGTGPRPGLVKPLRRIRRWITVAAAVIGAALLVYAAYALLVSKRVRQPDTPFRSATVRKLTTSGRAGAAAISPDAKLVGYFEAVPAGTRLVLRQVATAIDRVVWGPDARHAWGLSFSPGGDFLYFASRDLATGSRPSLWRVSVQGGEPRKVLDDVNGWVALSPDGRRLTFVRVHGDEYSLLAAGVDGSDQKVLLTRKAYVEPFGPAWSADGRAVIACVWDSDGTSDLVSVAAHDGAVTPLTSIRWPNFFEVASIPDGSGALVIGLEPSSQVDQIYFVPAAGGRPQRVTNDTSEYRGVSVSGDGSALVTTQSDSQPTIWVAPNGDPRAVVAVTSGRIEGAEGLAWTPDGRIVYGTVTQELWIMNADGGNQRLLTGEAPGQSWQPSVSPDGHSVFFDHFPPSAVGGVSRMGIDGGAATLLAKTTTRSYPRCSPDGKLVFYQLEGDPTSTIWMMSPDGGAKRPWKGKVDGYFAVSPDGTRLAGFYTAPGSSNRVMTITPVQGGEPDKIFSLPDGTWAGPYQGSVRWTPDRRAVAYIVGKAGVANLWMQPVDGGAPRPLTDFKDRSSIWSFDWGKDGRFAMARGPVNSDVVMMSREKP